jgi:hypothetical protein
VLALCLIALCSSLLALPVNSLVDLVVAVSEFVHLPIACPSGPIFSQRIKRLPSLTMTHRDTLR